MKKEWRGNIFYIQGTNQSNGLVISTSSKIMHEEMEIVREKNRILIIKLNISNVVYTFVDCYAPNTTTDKVNFLHQLQDKIQEIETDSLWVASDFNIALEQTDNIAGRPHHEREVTTLKEMLAKLDIHNVWRTNHPDRKEYTWSKPTPFTARRIDYIFCDTSLTKITNTSTEGFSHPDHKLVKVKINMNSFRRGPKKKKKLY